jgi:NAD+ diphosphatase
MSSRFGGIRPTLSGYTALPSSCHAEATSRDIVRDEAELEACRWFGRAEVHAMLAGLPPDGLKCPPDIAIAHHLIKAWAT